MGTECKEKLHPALLGHCETVGGHSGLMKGNGGLPDGRLVAERRKWSLDWPQS